MTLPNFLVIGAAKAGTTSLYYYLGQHPEVFVSPVKETNFFALEGQRLNFRAPGAEERINRWSITDLQSYEGLFEGVSGEKAVGEASPLYLYSEKAPARIRHHVPDAKLIAVLRNPAERAYSSFLHLVRNGREPLRDFGEALEAEDERIKENWEWIWHYRSMGFYHEQLSRYYRTFDPGRIRVYLYEDLEADPVGVSQGVFRFLGVDDGFVPDTSLKFNVTGVPRNRAVFTFLREPHLVKSFVKPFLPRAFRKRLVMNLQNRMLVRPPFPRKLREGLAEGYRDDVLKLQDLIGRDLSGWLA